mgnify:CR=1 FL=1
MTELAEGLGESQKRNSDSLMSFCMNTIISGLEVAVDNCSNDDISDGARMRIASTIIAYIQDFILPVKIAIGSVDEDSCVDGTYIARQLGAIPDHTNIVVESKRDEDGMHIRVAVGVDMEIPDELKESLSMANEVGRA